MLSPRTFSLLHAVDFADRLKQIIAPALKAGFIVLADRYAYTAFARDVARGVDPNWVRGVYNFAIKPDLSVYLILTQKLHWKEFVQTEEFQSFTKQVWT